MCGFIVSKGNKCNIDKFSKCLKNAKYRGPDNSDIYSHNNVIIGHNRLKIIDLSNNSNQPMLSSCGVYVIAYNGEIYNASELAKKYKLNLITSSDTEILLQLYILRGSKVLAELNGMFSFVIYNNISEELFAARDRLGVKPLYFFSLSGQIYFSSDIRSIVELADSNEIDEIGLRQYKKLRTFFNNHTLYKNIISFPSGCYYENGRIYKYWDCDFSRKEQPKDEHLFELIYDAIKLRMVSDVPVGSYLSGGLDSSIISAVSEVKNTWSIGFSNMNEFSYADTVANRIGSNHTNILISNKEFLEIAEKMVKDRMEPLSVPNEVLIYRMSQIASNENRVLLSGEGADELFSGYDRIFNKFSNLNSFDLDLFDRMYSYGSHKDDDILHYAIEPYLKYKEPYLILSSFFQISHLQGLLRRLDFSSMLASVEARSPFVDYRLVELMAGVDFSYKNYNTENKAPLKRFANNILEDSTIFRKKVGFPVPLDQIFLSENGYNDWLSFNLNILNIN